MILMIRQILCLGMTILEDICRPITITEDYKSLKLYQMLTLPTLKEMELFRMISLWKTYLWIMETFRRPLLKKIQEKWEVKINPHQMVLQVMALMANLNNL
jgi:hypothetical protein